MNAHACSDKSENVINTIKCAEGDNEFTVIKSETAGDLTKHAKELENSIIFSLGGDGTIFETVNGGILKMRFVLFPQAAEMISAESCQKRKITERYFSDTNDIP